MFEIPSTQIQLTSETNTEIIDHMKRFDYSSKNDFIIEVIIKEWLADNRKQLEEFRKKYKETNQE